MILKKIDFFKKLPNLRTFQLDSYDENYKGKVNLPKEYK